MTQTAKERLHICLGRLQSRAACQAGREQTGMPRCTGTCEGCINKLMLEFNSLVEQIQAEQRERCAEAVRVFEDDDDNWDHGTPTVEIDKAIEAIRNTGERR